MISKKLLLDLEKILATMPVEWDGKTAILETRDKGDRNWRQMEWIGFYFEFLCNKLLASLLKMPGPTYGKVKFDGFAEIPWDFKAHPVKNAKGKDNKKVIVNDKSAVTAAITEYGIAGLILAIGEATYDDQDRSFQKWHQDLKGGLSDYEIERIKRDARSRIRKTAFKLKEIWLILLDSSAIQHLGSFQKGFRNSDGSPRNAKVELSLTDIAAEISIPF